MSSTRRLLVAAAALSECLNEKQIRHAFYGTITTAVLGSGVNTEVGIIIFRLLWLSVSADLEASPLCL